MYFNTKINNPFNRSTVKPITMGTTDSKIFVCKFFSNLQIFSPSKKGRKKKRIGKSGKGRVEIGVFFFFQLATKGKKGRGEARRANKQDVQRVRQTQCATFPNVNPHGMT